MRAARIATIVVVGVVAWLVVLRARSVDWSQVGQALQRYEGSTLLAAALLAALSYAIYVGYELLSRAHVGHRVARRSVAAVAFVSYAFNLNFGTLIGGFGFRYRLYARHGLKPGVTTRILAMSLATNWLGYLALAGAVFVLGLVPLPPGWTPGGGVGLRAAGLAMLAVAGAYLVMCARPRWRTWRVRRVEVRLPPLPLALTQVALSAMNWLVMASIVFVLLHGRVALPLVLGALLVASIATVLARIPAGLGVVEGVFLALLGARVPESELLAALLAYRAIYYLAPVAPALAVYFALEHRTRPGASRRALPAP